MQASVSQPWSEQVYKRYRLRSRRFSRAGGTSVHLGVQQRLVVIEPLVHLSIIVLVKLHLDRPVERIRRAHCQIKRTAKRPCYRRSVDTQNLL